MFPALVVGLRQWRIASLESLPLDCDRRQRRRYYPYGGGLAKVLNEDLADVRATAEVTAASVDNMKLIRDGRADVAFTLADTLADAVAGRGAFDGRPVPAVSLAVLYSNYTQIITLASSGIRRVADLRDDRVHRLARSGTEVTALRLLAAAGVDPGRDVHAAGARRIRIGRCVEGRQDRRVLLERRAADRGGPGLCAHARDCHSPASRTPTDPAALQPRARRPLFRAADSGRRLPGVDGAVPVVGVANVLVVNRSMPDALAYDITRLLFEHQRELAAIHPEARNLTLATAVKGSPAPFHPGAIRYYRERASARVRRTERGTDDRTAI